MQRRATPRRGERAARRFLAEAETCFARNRPFLRELAGRYRLGIVSNFYGNLEAVCAGAGLSAFFGAMADSNRVGADKPDPAIFEAAMRPLGATAATTLFVGDSLHRDREGARRLGMDFVWIAEPEAQRTQLGRHRSPGHLAPDRPFLDSLMTQIGAITAGGIIAAGEGSRLRADGWTGSKPLVPVAGRPLIAHSLDRLRAAGIARIAMIINEESADCRQWLEHDGNAAGLDLVIRSTPSSYASFRIVADRLAGDAGGHHHRRQHHGRGRFPPLSWMRPPGFRRDAFVLGLTDHVDDEKPLWASLDSANWPDSALRGSQTAGL